MKKYRYLVTYCFPKSKDGMDITIQVAVVERANPIRNFSDIDETIKVLCKNEQARPMSFSRFED